MSLLPVWYEENGSDVKRDLECRETRGMGSRSKILALDHFAALREIRQVMVRIWDWCVMGSNKVCLVLRGIRIEQMK